MIRSVSFHLFWVALFFIFLLFIVALSGNLQWSEGRLAGAIGIIITALHLSGLAYGFIEIKAHQNIINGVGLLGNAFIFIVYCYWLVTFVDKLASGKGGLF